MWPATTRASAAPTSGSGWPGNGTDSRVRSWLQPLAQVAELPLGMTAGQVVHAEWIDRDLLVPRYLVVRGEDRGRGTDLVHQADAEQAVRGDPARQQSAVDVPQCVQDIVGQVDLLGEEVRDLLVRV